MSTKKLDFQRNKGRVNPRKIIAAAGIVGVLIFSSACSASVAASPDGTSSPSESASATPTPSPTPTSLARGVVAKDVANDGIGEYLQTSITDGDPAMQYDPAIVDDSAKAHFSEAELAEAQKVIVRFIAEEVIDSTLNGGTDVDGWWAAHKDQIHPANQVMLTDLKSENDILARERWMAKRPGLSYAHGAGTSRVQERTITPLKLYYVESAEAQGVMLDTQAFYEMPVTYGAGNKKVQSTTAEISIAVAKDPADGKWKIAGYNTNFHTTEFIIE